MTPKTERIPFEVEVSRVIEVLAKQIYQSPLALLRENVQNAFDAILMRRQAVGEFEELVSVDITENEIAIRDNGIGMTPEDLRHHYWRAGSSGKNTPEARAAGVVGTFGIGAMANFGIADALVIETESALSGERTKSSAKRDTLSTTEDCIELEVDTPTGEPGTLVRAGIAEASVDVAEAVAYIREFVAFVDVPVTVNGELVSQRPLPDALPPPSESEDLRLGELNTRLSGTGILRVTGAGEAWVSVRNLRYLDDSISGELVLRQGQGAIRTFRSGFGLAVAAASSAYNLGGFADIAILEPTAGREALTTESVQLLQELVTAVDEAVSLALAGRPEADQSTSFMQWVRSHGRYDLCGELKIRVEPGSQSIPLKDISERSRKAPVLVYAGADKAIMDTVASDDAPLVVIATGSPRRQCESHYLTEYCETEQLTDAPTVLRETPRAEWSLAQQALAFRIVSILGTDYFLTAEVGLGELSHGLPIVALVDEEPVRIVLDPDAPTFDVMAQLYASDYTMFGSMVKDYVRNVVFPRVSDLVPSSTRQGAEAFLKSIKRTRDVFEYEADDLGNLTRIWEEYLAGQITMGQAAERSIVATRQNVQVIEPAATSRVADVVPDVADSEAVTRSDQPMDPGPAPPIVRTEVMTDAKLLTVEPGDAPIYGHRCFIALSERAREERGEFFLQPHSTAVVWGGQKVLFVFEHHSEEFGLYYDLQTGHVVSPESGGGPIPTATIVLGNAIFIPVPDSLAGAFIPDGNERKRFEVRCDLLYTDLRQTNAGRPSQAPT
jgi:molecular chaperone HtpG